MELHGRGVPTRRSTKKMTLNRADKADELRNAGFSGTDDEVIEQYLVWVDETRDACADLPRIGGSGDDLCPECEGSGASPCSAVTMEDVEAIGEAVGMHHKGWDMTDPIELIEATLKHFKQNKLLKKRPQPS